MKKDFLFKIKIMGFVVISLYLGCSNKETFYASPKQQFNIFLDKSRWIETLKKEQWDYNGDGFYLCSYQTQDKKDIDDIIRKGRFHRLPIGETLPENDLLAYITIPKEGYYLLKFLDNDVRNFKIMLIDTLNKKVIIYHQFM